MHRLIVRVQPNASADRVETWETDAAGRTYLKVRVVRVVTGPKNRLKGLDIDGPPDLAAKLAGDQGNERAGN